MEEPGSNELRLALEAWAKNEYVDALKYLKLSANLNNGEACMWIGICYGCQYLNLRLDMHKRDEYYEKAAKLGNGWGMYSYVVTQRCAIDEKEYPEWGKKAFDSNHTLAKGLCYKNGIGTVMDKDKGFEWIKKAAEEGHPEAMQTLWLHFSNHLDRNPEISSLKLQMYGWLKKAADKGIARSQYGLGNFLAVPPNKEIAQFQYDLGNLAVPPKEDRFEPTDPKRNLTQAWYYYKKAAAQGYELSIITLKQSVFENFDLHERARNGILCLISIRKFRKSECGVLGILPVDVVILIGKILWEMRNEYWRTEIPALTYQGEVFAPEIPLPGFRRAFAPEIKNERLEYFKSSDGIHFDRDFDINLELLKNNFCWSGSYSTFTTVVNSEYDWTDEEIDISDIPPTIFLAGLINCNSKGFSLFIPLDMSFVEFSKRCVKDIEKILNDNKLACTDVLRILGEGENSSLALDIFHIHKTGKISSTRRYNYKMKKREHVQSFKTSDGKIKHIGTIQSIIQKCRKFLKTL